MLGFFLGISVTINLILVVGIIVYFNIKKNTKELKNLVEDVDIYKDFFK